MAGPWFERRSSTRSAEVSWEISNFYLFSPLGLAGSFDDWISTVAGGVTSSPGFRTRPDMETHDNSLLSKVQSSECTLGYCEEFPKTTYLIVKARSHFQASQWQSVHLDMVGFDPAPADTRLLHWTSLASLPQPIRVQKPMGFRRDAELFVFVLAVDVVRDYSYTDDVLQGEFTLLGKVSQ